MINLIEQFDYENINGLIHLNLIIQIYIMSKAGGEATADGDKKYIV